MFKYRLEYLAAKIVFIIVNILPRKIALKIADIIAFLVFKILRIRKNTVRYNLELVYGKNILNKKKGLDYNIYKNFAKTAIDFLRTVLITKNNFKNIISIKNLNFIDEGLKRNNGVIILTAHIGNWEYIAVTLGLLGYKMSCVKQNQGNYFINDLITYLRHIKNFKEIDKRYALRNSIKVLKNNEILGFVADQYPGEKAYELPFLGQETFVAKGTTAIAKKTNATVIPTFLVRNKNDIYTLIFEKPILFEEIDKTLPEEIREKIFTLKYLEVFESYINKYKEQWFWHHKRWRK